MHQLKQQAELDYHVIRVKPSQRNKYYYY